VKRLLSLSLCMLLATHASAFAGSPQSDCHDPTNPLCTRGSVLADQAEGDFHGLIMVPGQPGVLETAAHSGTQAGCGDCTWTVILACIFDSPDKQHEQTPCATAGRSRQCGKGQSLFRPCLAADAVRDQLVDTLCLGGNARVIPVGDIAAADVDRYLKNVVPPDLRLATQPPNATLAGLPTYFIVHPPAGLHPQRFGGPQVRETVTITPVHYNWSWGDGSADLPTDDPGGPYPDGSVTHTYARAGNIRGVLTADWTATYTITVAGETFGPYDATGGAVSHTQPFALTVDRAHSHLVSSH